MAKKLVLAVSMVAVMTLGGCGDTTNQGDESTSGRPPASEQPRDEEIRSIIDTTWAATGIDVANVYVGDYAYTFAPDVRACSELAREDRWFGERGSSIPPALIEQSAAEERITAHLEAEGFAVEHYRSTHPDSRVRGYRGVRAEVVVDGFLNEDGVTEVNVRSGPCAPLYTSFDRDLYEVDR